MCLIFYLQHDFVVIDHITLAVFESTGWYRIDYSNADEFIFGKSMFYSFLFIFPSCIHKTHYFLLYILFQMKGATLA